MKALAIASGVLVVWLASACRQSLIWLGDKGRDASVVLPAEPEPARAPRPSAAGAAASAGAAGTAGERAADGGSSGATGQLAPAPEQPPPGDAGSDTPGAADVPRDAAPDAVVPPVLRAPRLPAVSTACPVLFNGSVSFAGIDVKFWVGQPPAADRMPLVIYWHGTGSTANEAITILGATHQEILDQGGVIAALDGTTRRGQDTGTGTWYIGDLDIADQIVACAAQQLPIDERRIYTTGCSFGGVQAGVMAYARSEYVAAAMLNSGGSIDDYEMQDPANVPAVITTHGAPETDVVIVEFAMTSQRLARDIAARGGFAVNCPHAGGHCGSPVEVKRAQWLFAMAHPYGVSPSPYAGGLPATFPRSCSIVSQ